jgi:hypothetical protein
MADEQLTVKITAQTGDASSQIQTVEQRLTALEQAFIRGAAAGDAHSSAVKRTGEAATGATAALEAFNKQVQGAAGLMEAAGVEASVLGARLGALADFIKVAEKSFGPLLVALVAFEAAMKGFEFVQEATKIAGEFQAQMETLGASVETQGGDWERARADIEAWAAQEAMASGILRSELIPALNDLVTAGHSLHDSQTILAVAEEVAVAKHIAVRDVVRDLISAELGRARGLELLDANTKKVVDSHGHMSDLLKILHHDFEKAIEDDQSAERANNRLRAELEGVSLLIGNKLLPLMTSWSYTLLGGIKNAEAFGKGVSDSFYSIVLAAQSVVTATSSIGAAVGAAWDAVKHGNLKGAGEAAMHAGMARVQQAVGQMHASQAMSDRGAAEMWAVTAHGWDQEAIGRHAAGAAVKAHMATTDANLKRGLDVDDVIGKPKEKKGASTPGSSTSFSYTPIDPEATTKTDEYAQAQKDLEAALKRVDDAEKPLAENIKTATTASTQASAQAAYDAQVTIDLLDKKKRLSEAIQTENQQIKSLTAQRDEARSEEERYRQAYNEFAKELLAQANAGTAVTDQQKNDLAELKAHHDAAKKAADGFASSITTLNNNLRTNNTALGEVNAKLDEFKNKAAEAFAAASRSWEEYQKKQARSLQEDFDTWNMTNAQKVAYYSAALAKALGLFNEYKAGILAAEAELDAARKAKDADRIRAATVALGATNEAFKQNVSDLEQYDTKYTESYKAALHDRETAYKEFVTHVQGYEVAFIDGVLKQHKSIGDSFRDVLRKMVDDYITSLETMLMKSSVMQGLNGPNGAIGKALINAGVLAAPGGSTGNPQLDAAIAARITGEQRLVQSARALDAEGLTPTTSAMRDVAQAAQQAAAALRSVQGGGGSSGGGANLSPNALGLGVDIPPSAGSGSMLDQVPGFWSIDGNGLPVNVTSINSAKIRDAALPTSIEKMAGGALQGLMIGQMIAGIDGGNSMWASILGGVGGAFGGPLGAAAGGLLGSLLGPHWGPATNYPDRSDTQNYGQFLANWQGSNGNQVNGQTFNAAPQFNASMGGDSMWHLMELWANSGAASTDAQKALAAQIKALENGNPNADLGVTNEHNGTLTLADGSKISVTDAEAMASAYQQQVGTGLASSAEFQLTRTYPDLNLGTLSANGTYTPSTVTPGSTPAGGSSGTTGSAGAGTTGSGGGGTGGDAHIIVQIDRQTLLNMVLPGVGPALRQRGIGITPGAGRALVTTN